jgi:hypothetical protein
MTNNIRTSYIGPRDPFVRTIVFSHTSIWPAKVMIRVSSALIQ